MILKMKRSFFSIPAESLIAFVVVSACSQLDQSVANCDNLREEMVELSEEDRQSRGHALVKIREPRTLSKSEKRISCKELVLWTDGDKASITYQSYVDEDGDRMIEYEVN